MIQKLKALRRKILYTIGAKAMKIRDGHAPTFLSTIEYYQLFVQQWFDLYVYKETIEQLCLSCGYKKIAIIGNDEITKDLQRILNELQVKTVIVDSLKGFRHDDFDLILTTMKDENDHTTFQKMFSNNKSSSVSDFLNLVIYNYHLNSTYQTLKSRGISFVSIKIPEITDMQNPTEREKRLLSTRICNTNYLTDKISEEELTLSFGNIYSVKEIKHLLSNVPSMIRKGRYSTLVDTNHELQNVVSGRRITLDMPVKKDVSVHIFGSCYACGSIVDDSRTIPNFLQGFMSKWTELSGRHVQVIAHGTPRVPSKEYFARIVETSMGVGDIVVLIDNMVGIDSQDDRFFFDLQSDFERPHDWGEIFCDFMHPNWIGNQVIAQSISKICIPLLENREHCKDTTTASKPLSKKTQNMATVVDDPGFESYLNDLSELAKTTSGKIGAIVMNCNPFTFGHRYLIETASKLVDTLYIFVVEEDKSVFPFVHRMEMIKLGTADLSNVRVLPSGKYIISTLTFPDYFTKDAPKEVAINTAMDVELFAKYIAPALNINVRFVGQEPLCKVTRAYNESMKSILPEYNIEVIEFERIAQAGEPISASRVRRLMGESNDEELLQIIPKTTYDYLKTHSLPK